MTPLPQKEDRLIEQDPFSDLEIPPALEQSIQRHRVHLAQLVRTMRTAGIGADQIDRSVSVMIASYKEEVIRTINSMRR